MALLKDTVVAGSLRATDTLYATTGLFKIIKVATSNSNAAYSAGTAGQFLHSGGTSSAAYWGSLASSDIPTISITEKTTGTLPVSRGGTGATSFTANSVIMSGSNSTANFTTRGITDNTTPTAYTTSNTNLVTMNTLYYGSASINNARQTSSVGIYAPTSGGSAGLYLKATGSTATPTWANFPTTLSGYGITDAKISSGVITLGSNTITPVTSVNGHTGSSVSVTASDLGLSNAMHFKGIATVEFTASNFPGLSNYTPAAGDVIIDKNKKYEYVYIDSTNGWELLGGDESYALSSAVINKSIITAKGDIIYGNASADPTILAGNTTTTVKFLSMASSTPSWVTLSSSDIPSIPKSKISDFSHTHGNITNDGKIGSTANYAVYTTTGGTVTASSFTVNSPTASGTATSFIATVSQDSKGQITATKASLPTASTTTAGITTVGASGGAAAYSHGTHVSYGTSAAAVSTSASAGSAGTVSRSDHVHSISLATGDGNGQIKIAGQNVGVKGLESGAFTTAYVHPTSAGNIHLPSGGATGNFLKYGGSSGTGTWSNILTNDVKPIVTKTYANTNLYGTGNNDTSNSFYFMSVKPDGWYKPWQIKFRIRSFCPGYSNVDSITWCTLNGRADSIIYHNWNERYDVGHYYVAAHILKSAGFNAGLGHAVGINIRYGSGYTNSAYYRTFELELYETVNCTVTTLDNATLWANWTNGTDTNYNGFSNYNAIDRGLMETGDIDTTGRDFSHSAYTTNNSTFRLPPYSLFGFDRDGKTQGISLYSSEYDSSTVSINTARVYNTNGIDWTRGLWYTNSGTNFAKGADVNISPAIFFYALDFRYSDNCVASSGASTLGLLPRKHVYLRGVIKSDGLFYLAPLSVTYNNATYKRAWTQDIPTSVLTDGTYQYVYWLVGDVYYNGSYANGGYQVNLITENKMYWYNNNRFEEYFGNTGVTSITLKAGAGITLDTDNTAITSTGTRTISINGINTSTGSESSCLTAKGTWKPFNNYSLPVATYNTLGGVKPAYSSTNAATLTTTAATNTTTPTIETKSTTSNRYYGVETDKNGILFVNVPWTNVNNSYLTGVTVTGTGNAVTTASVNGQSITLTKGTTFLTSHQTYTSFTGKPTGNLTPGFGSTFTILQISQSTTGLVSGTDRTVTIPETIATNTVKGLVKPWYSHTAASTGPTTGTNATAVAVNAISTTSGKYYAVEADSNGRLFVNVPWSNVNSSYLTGISATTTGNGNAVTSVTASGSTITVTKGASYVTTDTKNTAGSTSSASKLFLIGAASLAANPLTYSHSRVFETAGAFSAKTLGINADSDANKATLLWNSTLSAVEFVFA